VVAAGATFADTLMAVGLRDSRLASAAIWLGEGGSWAPCRGIEHVGDAHQSNHIRTFPDLGALYAAAYSPAASGRGACSVWRRFAVAPPPPRDSAMTSAG
jgi:hypothetical protein